MCATSIFSPLTGIHSMPLPRSSTRVPFGFFRFIFGCLRSYHCVVRKVKIRIPNNTPQPGFLPSAWFIMLNVAARTNFDVRPRLLGGTSQVANTSHRALCTRIKAGHKSDELWGHFTKLSRVHLGSPSRTSCADPLWLPTTQCGSRADTERYNAF